MKEMEKVFELIKELDNCGDIYFDDYFDDKDNEQVYDITLVDSYGGEDDYREYENPEKVNELLTLLEECAETVIEDYHTFYCFEGFYFIINYLSKED